MNVAPSALLTMLDARAKDPLCAIEFYAYTYVPDSTHGFLPDQAVARFATETATFTYLATSASYQREVFAMPSLNRQVSKQSNSVTVRMSNVPTADDPSVRPLADFVLNNEVEGMRMVIRILSRSQLSNPTVSPAERSFVAFVARCGPPEGFDRGSGSITAKQDLGQIEAIIPPRVFQKACPLDFGGEECLGTELLTDKNAAYQAAFAALGRFGCNKTHTQCFEFENTEFFQGQQIVQIQGSFIHRPHEGFFAKLIGLLTPGSGKRRMRVGSSVEDGTPYGKAIPEVLGRWQMIGIPLQYHDIGTSINFLLAFCRGRISDIFNVVSRTVGFDSPSALTEHYGDYGGEANQLADTVFPEGGFFSRLAYLTGQVTGSDIAVEEPVPDISAVVAGRVIEEMTTAHLMNRCGSGRISGGGMAYLNIFSGRWVDNPVEQVRILLLDPALLNLSASFIETHRTYVTSAYCCGAIMDVTNAERLLLPNTEIGKAGVDYKRYNSTGLIGKGNWPITTGQFPFSVATNEATYEYFDPDNPPAPGDIEVKTVYRKRWTSNIALAEQKKVVDVLFDTILPSFRGFLTWNSKGQIAVRSEKPSDSTLLRTASIVGATTLELEDVMPWKEDINENGFGQTLIGKILIGVGLSTSEVRRVTAAVYNATAGNAITLDASATGGTTATAGSATLTGGGIHVQSHGIITIAGTAAVGDTVTAIIDGISVTYTIEEDDSGGIAPYKQTAAGLGFAINGHPVLSRYVVADNDGWNDWVDIYSKYGTVTLSSALEEAHDAEEETIRVMMSFAGRALTYANTTKANILDGSFKYLGTNGQTRYNQFKGTFHDPLRDFAEQPLIVNDYDHQEKVQKIQPLELDLSAVDNYNQASRLLNGANAKFGDGMDFFSWGSNGLALQLEEGDVVCVSDDSGEFRNVPIRVEQANWNSRYEVSLTGRIYSTSMFNDTVEQTDVVIPSGLTNFGSGPPSISFNVTDFPPDGLVQSTDGTAGITSIRGGAVFGDSVYAQYATVRLIKRAGVTVNEQVSVISPDSNMEAVFEFIASADGLYTVELEVCNQWGCNSTKPTADIVIGFGSLYGLAMEDGFLLLTETSDIIEVEH